MNNIHITGITLLCFSFFFLSLLVFVVSKYDLHCAKVLEKSGHTDGRYSRQGGQLKWGRLTENKMSLDDV